MTKHVSGGRKQLSRVTKTRETISPFSTQKENQKHRHVLGREESKQIKHS